MQLLCASKIAIAAGGIVLTLAACDSAPLGAAATAVPSIATAAPTAGVVATRTPVPSNTAAPQASATAAPAPSNTPALEPSATPAPPTATLAPLEANTIPEGGEFEDELPFNTTANDPAVGNDSGDGIANVTFEFFDSDGNLVYTRTENNTLYCAFGGGDNGQDCDRWLFSEHENQWPNGKPAQSGLYKIMVTIQGVRGGTARNERQATLNLIQE